jgi:serine/threonine protein kinase
VDSTLCFQAYHALQHRSLYGVHAGSPEERAVLAELASEINMLASLHHDKILSLRGVCFDAVSGQPKYIVLELASGSLRGYLRSLGRRLTLNEFKGFGEDMLDGMSYLHSLVPAVVHRDLKPENVLVFITRGFVTLKLGDVGLARFLATNNRGTIGAGTMYYMAPEVMFGRYDAKVDVFSFGVMLAEIVVVHMREPAGVAKDMALRLEMIESAVAYLRGVCAPLADMLEACCCLEASGRITAQEALAQFRSVSIAPVTDCHWVAFLSCRLYEWFVFLQTVPFSSLVSPSGSSLTSESGLDVGALIDTLERHHVADDVILAIVNAVESRPDITMDGLVTVIKNQGVDTVKAHRIRAALTPGSVLRIRAGGHSDSSVPVSVGVFVRVKEMLLTSLCLTMVYTTLQGAQSGGTPPTSGLVSPVGVRDLTADVCDLVIVCLSCLWF